MFSMKIKSSHKEVTWSFQNINFIFMERESTEPLDGGWDGARANVNNDFAN